MRDRSRPEGEFIKSDETAGIEPTANMVRKLEQQTDRELEFARHVVDQDSNNLIYPAKPAANQAEEFIQNEEASIVNTIARGNRDEILQTLAQPSCSAHLDSSEVIKSIYGWLKENRDLVEQKSKVCNEILDAIAEEVSKPQGFLRIAPELDDSWLCKEILKRSRVDTTVLDRTNPALSEYVYDCLLKSDSGVARIMATRFLCELSIENLLKGLARDLDGATIPIATRCLIAEIIGNHPQHMLGAETLMKHLFPLPYDNTTEAFNANLGKFAARVAAGMSLGTLGMVMFARILPKNPYFLAQALLIGVGVSTWYGLRQLYKSLNQPRVRNQQPEVQRAAANGLARMLTHEDSMSFQMRKQVLAALEANITRLTDHKLVGTLRQAMATEPSSLRRFES